MPRCIYEKIRAAFLSVNPDFLEQRPGALGKMGATTDQKVTSDMRQLCYGATADSLVECLRLSESLNALCLKHFCNAIILALKSKYLRLPNRDELKAIEAEYSAVGFPGCGFVVLEQIPGGWQGQYRGKEGKSCCRLEVVRDDSICGSSILELLGHVTTSLSCIILHYSTR
jgi:hypothetical protein